MFRIGQFPIYLLLILFSVASPCRAQQPEDVVSEQPVSVGQRIEDEMELLMEQEEADYDPAQWEDELLELHRKLSEPLNLNTATREQLEQFPFLTDAQVEQLFAYRYLHGDLQTIYELPMVKLMDRRTIDLLTPFVCVQPVEQKEAFPSWGQLTHHGQHQVSTRLDVPLYRRKGYIKTYLGPSLYHSLRYRYHYRDLIQLGLTAEKDAGEPMFALHNRKGYDSYSPYFVLRDYKRLRTLALGHYKLNFGLGLVMQSGFRLGKTYSLSNDYRNYAISPHASTDEYNYFRGAAFTLAPFRRFELTAFYSHRNLEGTLKNDTLTAIYKTGLHRSQKEAGKRHAATLQAMGGHVVYRLPFLHVGLTGLYYFFDKPYIPRLSGYARYNLHGQRFYNYSIDYRFFYRQFSLSGEAAKGTKGYALLNKLSYRPNSSYRFQLIHRLYTHDYQALFARSFGDGSTPQNENGYYLAAELAPWTRWRFFLSADFFSFPTLKYRISKPSQGMDLMGQATYTPRKNFLIVLNYRYKRKERDLTGITPKVTLPYHQHRARLRFTYTPHDWILRTTFDYTCFNQPADIQPSGTQSSGSHQSSDSQSTAIRSELSHGYHLSQLVSNRWPLGGNLFGLPSLRCSGPLTANLQLSYFHAPDYDARLYATERGLLYTFNSVMLYGHGLRGSLVLRYDFSRSLSLLTKYGITHYFDREEISSGDDLITGRSKNDLQFQLNWKF